MTTHDGISAEDKKAILTDDQQHACERLLSLARVRTSTTETALPVGVLNQWSVPLLIGPAGCGKGFVCRELAHQWDRKPCRRWELGSWMLLTNRSSHTTLEQIQAFIGSNAAGCVVYLAGVHALASSDAHNAGYFLAIAAEIAQFLDQASARPATITGRDGKVIPANVLVVIGGCFPGLWGGAAIGSATGPDSWKLADTEPLGNSAAVAKWLLEHSQLPTDILRRLAPEPMVLPPIDGEQARRLAVRLRDNLPPSLDGLSADEFSVALQSPHGWRAVAALIERAWVAGHEQLPALEESVAIQPKENPPPAQTEPKSVATLLPLRLGERLGIPSSRSRLLGSAKRLGLRTIWDMEKLAVARGYLLPGEILAGTALVESVERAIFTDTELTAAMLSPCLEWNERVICRGAWMLAAQLVSVNPASIVYEARRARGETVVRHVAWIGGELNPQSRCWRDLLLTLPPVSTSPEFPVGIMPDDAIRRILSASLA